MAIAYVAVNVCMSSKLKCVPAKSRVLANGHITSSVYPNFCDVAILVCVCKIAVQEHVSSVMQLLEHAHSNPINHQIVLLYYNSTADSVHMCDLCAYVVWVEVLLDDRCVIAKLRGVESKVAHVLCDVFTNIFN
jgi:hypothetical protein